MVCWSADDLPACAAPGRPAWGMACTVPKHPKPRKKRTRAHGALEVLVVGQRAQLQADQHERGVDVPARAALPGRHHVEQQVQEHRAHELRPAPVSASADSAPGRSAGTTEPVRQMVITMSTHARYDETRAPNMR